MQRTRSIILLILQVVALIYYAYLRIHNADDVREPRAFGDTGDYLHNAGLPVFSREFWVDARPPVTALFWKAVDSDPEAIFQLQLYFSILCWAVLARAFASSIRSQPLQFIGFLVVLAFSLSRD